MGVPVPSKPFRHKSSPAKPGYAVALLNAGAVEGRPDELLLLRWGRNDTRKGLFIVNERTLACLKANQQRLNRQRVKGDYEHASVDEDPDKHPMEFGSDGVPEVRKGIGLLVTGIHWTQSGLTHVPEHYGDLSAAPIYDEKTREVIALHSYAHCRHGAADGASIEESLKAQLAALNASLGKLSNAFADNPNQEPAEMEKHTELLVALLAALGATLPESPSDEQIAAAAAAAMSKIQTKPEEANEVETLRASVARLSADLTQLSAEVKQANELRPFEDMRNDALAVGKMVTLSAPALQKLGKDEAENYLKSLPEGAVPLEQRTPARLSTTPSPLINRGPSADEVQAFRDLGISHPSSDKKA